MADRGDSWSEQEDRELADVGIELADFEGNTANRWTEVARYVDILFFTIFPNLFANALSTHITWYSR